MADPVMTADYSFNAAGLLISVFYGNLTVTVYSYDAAQRLTSIEHIGIVAGMTLLKLVYTYTDNNLVKTITESDAIGVGATVSFGYDARGRLTSEIRNDFDDWMRSYNITYQYDQGGNRIKMVENVAFDVDDVTYYTYDIEDPAYYGSKGNRLVYSKKENVNAGSGSSSSSSTGGFGTTGTTATIPGGGAMAAAAPPSGPTITLLEEKWYYYEDDFGEDEGNVTRVVTRDVPTEQYSAVRLAYAANERTVTFVSGERWDYLLDDNLTTPQNYDITYAREFRYDGARQRYLSRILDPAKLLLSTPEFDSLGDTWSDYDGDSIYGDFMMIPGDPPAPPTASNLRSYEPGIGKVDSWTALAVAWVEPKRERS